MACSRFGTWLHREGSERAKRHVHMTGQRNSVSPALLMLTLGRNVLWIRGVESRCTVWGDEKEVPPADDLDGPQNTVEQRICFLHKEKYVGVSKLAEYRYMIESSGVVELVL